MIPKIIHYVWIGGPKGNVENICINSWREKLPDYEIMEWNENTMDIESEIKGIRFLEECYKRKIWAFISDYIRIKKLYEYGGVYLDTDMQILKDITELLEDKKVVLGYESEEYVNCAIVATEKGNPFCKNLMEFYKKDIMESDLYTIPKVVTYMLSNKYKQIDRNNFSEGIYIYDQEYFYPFHFTEEFNYSCIKENTYGIHWWGKSWAKKRSYFLETKHMHGLEKIIKVLKIFIKNSMIRFKKGA